MKRHYIYIYIYIIEKKKHLKQKIENIKIKTCWGRRGRCSFIFLSSASQLHCFCCSLDYPSPFLNIIPSEYEPKAH